METPLTYHEAFEQLRGWPTNCPLRVEKKVAQKFLLENAKITFEGRVFSFGIKDLGLGVCEVWKQELNLGQTRLYPKNYVPKSK